MPGHFSPAGASRNLFLTGAPLQFVSGRLVPVQHGRLQLHARGRSGTGSEAYRAGVLEKGGAHYRVSHNLSTDRDI